MRQSTSLLAVLALMSGCSPSGQRTGASGWTDSLKTELLERVAEDQVVRERFIVAMQKGGTPDLALVHELGAIDSANTAWLRDLVQRHGWPDSSVIGAEGAKGAFLLVQHADQDTAFQALMLDSLQAAFDRGQANGSHVALLTDRVLVARGDSQRYGTQTQMRDGRFVFEPIKDSANVDARRKAMGLPPLVEYLKVLDSVYNRPRTP
jgi:hypothetical protein